MNKTLKITLASLAGIVLLAILLFIAKPIYWINLMRPVSYEMRAVNTKLTDDKITMDLQIMLANDHFLDLFIDSLVYEFYLDTTSISRGSTVVGKNYQSGDKDTLTLPLVIDKTTFEAKTDTMAANEKTNLRIALTNYVNLALFGTTSFDITMEQSIYAPILPKIRIAKIEKEKLKLHDAVFNIDFEVQNKNMYQLDITSLDALIDFEKLFIGKVKKTERVSFKPQSTTIFSTTMDIDDLELIKDGFKILFQPNKKWAYDMEANVKAILEDGTYLDFDIINSGKMDIVRKREEEEEE